MLRERIGRIQVLELGFIAGYERNFCGIFCLFCSPVRSNI